MNIVRRIVSAFLFFLAFSLFFALVSGSAPVSLVLLVLLAGFIALGVLIWPRKKKKAQPSAAHVDDAPFKFMRVKVAGVTFDTNGISRQEMLRRIACSAAPFETVTPSLRSAKFQGETCIEVLANGRLIGYVQKEDIAAVQAFMNHAGAVVQRLEVVGGGSLNWGARVHLKRPNN